MQVMLGSCKDMTWIPSGMDSMLNERFQYSTSLLSSALLSSRVAISTSGRTKQTVRHLGIPKKATLAPLPEAS